MPTKGKSSVAITVQGSKPKTLKIIYKKEHSCMANDRESERRGGKKRQKQRHQLQKAFILINSFLLH